MKIVLVVGGSSPERAVSKLTSASVYKALLANGHTVALVDPAYGAVQPQGIDAFFAPDNCLPVATANYTAAFERPEFTQCDAVFIGLHGKWGEDGTVQALLDLKGIPYTGSGVLASSLAIDKHMAKIVFKDHGVAVPEGFLALPGQSAESVVSRISGGIGFPVVVKPNDQGSTVGLTICHTPEQIPQALADSFAFSGGTVVEQFIAGRELTVGIVDQRVLPVLEIRPKHDLYDYECKYTKGMSEYLVPADIPPAVAAAVQQQTMLAYNALNCKGYARADFRLDAANQYVCMEINTLPGMTATSLLPKMAAADGMPFEVLVETIVQLASCG